MATREPIVDWGKVRRVKEALTPDLYKGTPYQPDPPPKPAPQPPVKLQGVEPEKAPPKAPKPEPQPEPQRARQAPPEVVARKPGPPAASVAASSGTGMGPPKPVDSVSRGTPKIPDNLPQDVPPELDLPAFHYRDQVEAMERKAMEQGRPDEAARLRGAYNQLIDGQFRHIESEYKAKTLPQVQAMQQELLKFQGRQLPRELAMKARETVQQAGQQQQQMMAFMYGLARNDATKGLGIQYFNESELLEPGVQLADLVVDEKTGMLVGVDAQGQTVKMSSGQDFAFPIDAAEQLYNDFYGSDRKENVILPEGAQMVDATTGRVKASNPKDQSGTRDEQLTAVKDADRRLARALGIELDSTGRLMEGVDQNTRNTWMNLSAEAGMLVREGMDPEKAALTVWQKHQQSGATQAAPATQYDGPRPWAPAP